MEIGEFTRLPYTDNAYKDKEFISVGPGNHNVDFNSMYNDRFCLSTSGPRYTTMGPMNSMPLTPTMHAFSQNLVDLESILSNRNVHTSKARTGHLNPINPTRDKAKYQVPECGRNLIPEYSRLEDPPCNYRDMSINRFYNPIRDLQKNIFYDFAVNTRLEVKDNYKLERPTPWKDLIQPPVKM